MAVDAVVQTRVLNEILIRPMKAMFSIPLLAGALVWLMNSSAPAQLLHRYDFETTGTANDTVGSAHGTRYGTSTISGGALNTTGATGSLSGGVPQNCVGLPASAVAGITGPFSIEVWYNANYNGGYCTLFSFSGGTTANYVLATPARGVSPYQSSVGVKGGGGSASEQLANQVYCDQGSLREMLVTYDGTNVTYYVNGVLSSYSGLQNSFVDVGLVLSNLTYIGIAGGSPYGDNTINGKVYDFRIYGHALTKDQALAIYKLGTNPSNSSIANALAAPPPSSEVPFNANLVDLPLYGDIGAHDPSTMNKDGSRYNVFTTGAGIPNKYTTDLRNWSTGSAVYPGTTPPAWVTNEVSGYDPNNWNWAPDIAYFNGKYHLYYSVSSWGSINSVIGLFTSPSLTSPTWTDQGKVVQSDPVGSADANTDTTAYNCIDPSIMVDTNGTVWMSFGSYFSGISVTQIDPATGKRMNTNTLVATQVANNSGGGGGSSIEGSCLFQHGGFYYLFVNYGGCCNGLNSTYNIRMGRGLSPTGPFYDKNGFYMARSGGTVFLESSGRFIGPGHAAILNDNGTNWFTYHYYDGNSGGAPKLALNRIYWTADGWPALLNDWSALYPLAVNVNETSGTYNGSKSAGATYVNDPARGNVLSLDGSSGYVSLPLSVGNASTFAAWVKWNGGAAGQRILDFGNDAANYFYITPSDASSGNLRFAITTSGAGGEQGIAASSALPVGSWHHVAVTLDGSTSTGILYLDGVPVASNSISLRPWQTLPQNNNLGRSQVGSSYFSGAISSLRIFGRALPAAEISDIYLANPTLAHRYSFNTNGLSAVWDSIGMAHGTLMGNATVTNNALKLTGASGGYANLPNGLVSGSSAVTLEFWATFGVNSNWARVFDTGGISGGNGYNYLYFTPHSGFSQQESKVSTAGGTQVLATGSVLDNQTVHVAAIWDPAGSYMAIFTNGVLEAQQTVAVPSPTGVAGVFDANAWSFIGRSLFSSDAYLNGTIDELRLYTGRLTAQQIAANYLAGPGVLQVPSVTATNIAFASTSGMLTLTWPEDHKGWRLQVQTNTLAEGLGTNWFNVEGSSATNAVTLPMVYASGGVFYRLIYP